MWREALPPQVQQAIAGMQLGGGNLEITLEKADQVYATLANGATGKVAGISADGDVAGIGRGRGRGARGRGSNSGNSRGGGSNPGQSKSSEKPAKHPDNPPDSCCPQHIRWGKSAHYCRRPTTCPWASYTVVPEAKKS